MKIYLAGPMRTPTGCNADAFDEAEKRWKAAGWQVFSPANTTRAIGYGFGDNEPVSMDRLRHVLLLDVVSLANANAVAVLPGWEASKGATFEVAVAQFLGLAIYDAVTMNLLDPDFTPWLGVKHLLATVRDLRRDI